MFQDKGALPDWLCVWQSRFAKFEFAMAMAWKSERGDVAKLVSILREPPKIEPLSLLF